MEVTNEGGQAGWCLAVGVKVSAHASPPPTSARLAPPERSHKVHGRGEPMFAIVFVTASRL
jgi:hypothetical protein